MFKKLFIPFLLLFINACTTMSKDACVSQDWRDYARERIQIVPRDFNGLANMAKAACEEHNIAPNLEALKQGYVEGLNIFCQSKNVWEKGLEGESVNLNYCPSANRKKLQRVYEAASYIHEIEELEEKAVGLEDEIARLNDEAMTAIRNDNSSEFNLKKAEISRKQSELSTLRLKIKQMRRRAQTFNHFG